MICGHRATGTPTKCGTRASSGLSIRARSLLQGARPTRVSGSCPDRFRLARAVQRKEGLRLGRGWSAPYVKQMGITRVATYRKKRKEVVLCRNWKEEGLLQNQSPLVKG
jgi:hypothetical protein